jgi:hypothetical protein
LYKVLWIVLALVCLLLGTGGGVLLHAWWARRMAQQRRRIPRSWPLHSRVVANTEELRVWRWLARAFPDHSVMVKMPVTRFTLPRDRDEGQHWYDLLSGVYCTLSVVNANGQVMGCIDAPGEARLSRRTYQLKESLLAQCGIPYAVLESTSLPTLPEIRALFLGEAATMPDAGRREEAAMRAASANLRTSLMRQRETRASAPAPLEMKTRASGKTRAQPEADSDYPSSWQQNSFIMPLDSRMNPSDE